MNKIIIVILISLLLFPVRVEAETVEKLDSVRSITLDEVISIAGVKSVDAAVALNELKTAYWEYRTFRSELLPEMNFMASLPSYNQDYNPYQQSDGSYTFVRNNYIGLNGTLSIDQNIWFTGGKISLSTSLDYFKQLDGDKQQRFMSVPVALTLDQPIFSVNHIKWKRRIEPIRYEEAKAAYVSATEEVTMKAIQNFFNLLLAKERVLVARQNMDNAEKLYEVAKAKRNMGQISENEVLQLELNVLEARSTLTDNVSNMKSSMFALRSFLAMDTDVILDPVLPESLPEFNLRYEDVLDKAMINSSFLKNIERRHLETDYEVATAKGELREMDLYVQFGLTDADQNIGGAYKDMKTNQVLQVGLRIPLLDWGKRKGKVKVAESNRDVILSKLRQEEQDFRQNIFILVENFNNQQQQLQLATASDGIAQRRYHTNVETFMIGKISTLDLNDSQSKKDEARQKYIQELFNYWYYYYQIRSLTLWDFAAQTNIDADFEKIIRQ